MKNIIKFIKASQMVVDPLAGTFKCSKTCIMLWKHRKSIGCEIDPMYFNASITVDVEMFARQVLNREFNITGTVEVRESGKEVCDGH